MSKLPTASDRTQAALAGATTKATPFADAEKWEMAYKVLLSGVRSAQRANRASQAGTVLSGLWSVPGVKPAVLGGAAALAAALTRSKARSESGAKPDRKSGAKSKSKSKSRSRSTVTSPALQPADASTPDSTVQSRNRFRRRPRPTSVASGAVTPAPDSSMTTR
jgi:hypothetical protein